MLVLIPILNVIFNLIFLGIFQYVLTSFIPSDWLPFNDVVRTLLVYIIIVFGMYTQFGQRCVAFFARGRNTIGREEKMLQPIIEYLKDRTDIRGYSAPVYIQFRLLDGLNNLTARKIKVLDRTVNRIKYEYLTGTIKIFTYDSLDIETNSYGNSIFISKGALNTLTQGEIRAVIYNEFAQIKTNVANMRLLHDGNILIGRISAIFTLILTPLALTVGVITSSVLSSYFNIGSSFGNSFVEVITKSVVIFGCGLVSFIRIILWILTKKWTNTLYMFYERKIFIKADRATHKAGFSEDIISYLEKLYAFKLGDKELSKLFVELRPLVAYRINYFDNVLGRNIELSEDNYAWSSNYMERVQTINNNKSL